MKQIARHTDEYRLVKTENSSLDVIQAPVESVSAADSRVVAPVQILVQNPGRAGASESVEPRKNRTKNRDATAELGEIGNAVITGRVMIDGASTPIEFRVPHEPKIFWLDRNREVFARFYSEVRNPKRTYYRQGIAHQSAGRAEAAEQAYHEALMSELWTGPDYLGLEERLLEREKRDLDTEIHLRLARLYTDQGADERARQEIKLARKAREHIDYSFNKRLAMYECRLDLLGGDAERAFKRLRRIDVSLAKMGTEGYLLFAIAAKRAGKEQAFERALRVLRARDVDVSLLTEGEGGAVVASDGP